MMKQTRRAAALALAALMALGLTACGGKNADGAVNAAVEKLKAASSLDAVMELTMSYAGEGEEFTMTNIMSVTMFSDPFKLKADVKMESGGEALASPFTTYAIQEGETVTQYATDGSSWAKKATVTDDLSQYDVRGSLARYLGGGADYKEAGAEQVGGRDAVKYGGTVSGEALVQLLDDTGSLSSISAMSADQQTKIKENLQKLPPLAITVWVDKENGCPVQFEMDMTKLLTDMEANIDETLGHPGTGSGTGVPELGGYVIKMTCLNFGAATAFELPAEAADAEDVG